jgi:glycosyltransferase involved in cell wall biosynthesis
VSELMPSIEVLRLDRDAAALNEALEQTSADYMMLVDADARPTQDAVGIAERALRRFPETDVLYGDSIDESGQSVLPRPIFSPLRLRSQDYLGGVKIFRSELLRTLGGFRSEMDGVYGHDLALRATAAGATVLHVPEQLDVSDLAGQLSIARIGDRPRVADVHREQRQRAVSEHLADLGIVGEVQAGDGPVLQLDYPVVGSPLVSIIVPTRGSAAKVGGGKRVLVVEAVRRILDVSTYDRYEIVVVADDATPQVVIDSLVEIAGDKLRLVRWSDPFNFSGKINRGAVWASGEYLIPLNDDIELISPDWIERLLGLAQQPGIGLVGTALYFEDGTFQHAGHLYRDGGAGHIAFGWQADWDDRLSSLKIDREVGGVTAACAMISADVFWNVGGFSNLFPGNYNDADLCMKIRRAGARIIWTPHVKLYHFESKSRVATIAPSEIDAIQARWGSRMQLDPYWPEN